MSANASAATGRAVVIDAAVPLAGWRADPPGAPAGRRHAAVVVMPAIAGLNDYVRRVVGRLADQGFVALAVDTFSREGRPPDVSTPERIGAAVAALPDDRAVADAHAAFACLQADPAVRPDAIGVLGFCIGGTHAVLAASRGRGFRAAVNFYGVMRYAQPTPNKPVSPIERVAALEAPLLSHVGTTDRLISAEDREAFDAALRAAGKHFESYVYPGAPHAFHEDFRPEVYRAVAAAEAWQRTLLFLRWHLDGAAPAA